jgi:hypothetical protein
LNTPGHAVSLAAKLPHIDVESQDMQEDQNPLGGVIFAAGDQHLKAVREGALFSIMGNALLDMKEALES